MTLSDWHGTKPRGMAGRGAPVGIRTGVPIDASCAGALLAREHLAANRGIGRLKGLGGLTG